MTNNVNYVDLYLVYVVRISERCQGVKLKTTYWSERLHQMSSQTFHILQSEICFQTKDLRRSTIENRSFSNFYSKPSQKKQGFY